MNKNLKKVIHELKHHAPFTATASIIAIITTLFLIQIIKLNINEEAFHSIHLLHLLASSFVSAAIFYKYKKNPWLSILVGVASAIIIGSISDTIFPWLGGRILALPPSFHLPILEIPLGVISISVAGSFLGIWLKKTKFPHTLHVFLSAFASLFYLLTFSKNLTPISLIISIIIVFIAVIIPCCVSDIIMPFLFLKQDLKQCPCH